ncbi:thioesterase family protein [Aliikangiella sp. IMCC44359]|uniref:thioesterase family protein n=1 Tax=Aliikangiella sp. IMCC44359 TaxID=3459125 RepID=UPI00403B36BE
MNKLLDKEVIDSKVFEQLLSTDNVKSFQMYPRFEGCNINTYIGFKHVMYLAEEAVIQFYREHGIIPRKLYEDNGICFDLVDHNIRILHGLKMDDLVDIEVQPKKTKNKEMVFAFRMYVDRDGKKIKASTGNIAVMFKQHDGVTDFEQVPDSVQPFVVSKLDRTGQFKAPRTPDFDPSEGRGENQPDDSLITQVYKPEDNVFVWKWHIPYIYCHYTKFMQMSGYVRIMEEVADLFWADRGISIYTYLDTRQWIPVVPSAKITMLQDAIMEETIYTVFRMDYIFRDSTYTHIMDCYVKRDGNLVHVATGEITHGYAKNVSRKEWKLVSFDEITLNALNNK